LLNGIFKNSRRVAFAAAALSLACTGISPAFAGNRNDHKNDRGTYTVKCHVVENAPGNPIIGLVYGNDSSDLKKAEKNADLFIDKFGDEVHKRHCHPQKRYKDSGAFTVNGEPI
jgi:hypothetical protein